MILQLFSPPGEGVTLQSCKLGEICDAVSFEFEKFFCGAGTFTLEIPADSSCSDRIGVNTLIYSRKDDMCFIVKNLKKTENTLKITGYDLNGMLLDRLTMPPLDDPDNPGESDDKDAVSGSTETCVKHFVDYNMISSPENARNYPRFVVAEDRGRGLAGDRNYCGKECVEDVVRIMCEGAELGYRIRLDTGQQSAEKPLILFDVSERVDKSAGQSERNRVIFSAGLKNVAETEREVGITAHKNVLWCEAGSIHDGFVYEQDGVIPAGWGRREEYVSISVADKDNPEDIVLYGRKEMSDKFAQTDSLVIDAGNPLDFGAVYDVGDIVTAYDPEKKVQLDSVISAATVKRSGTEYSVKLTLGESKPKLLDGYASQSDLLKKNQRDYPAAQIPDSSSGAALTEYEYLADLSVKYNGITYTAEKDADTGLISRISDSYNREFKPKINAGITDVALHNAVFWAVAMHSGFGRVVEKLLYTGENGAAEFGGGLTGFKDIKGSWQANGGQDITALIDGAAVSIEKPASLTYNLDGYTDAIIVRSNEKINFTGYSKLRVLGIVFTNYPDGLTAAAYFNIGEPPAAQQHTAYDFTGWEQIDRTQYYSADYTNPGDFKIYDIDISKMSGNQYLNFAVYHGAEWYTNSCYFYIKSIALIP